MKHSLDIHIVSNSQAVLDAIKNRLPLKLDSKVWSEEYSVSEGDTDNGDKYVFAMVRFNQDVNRRAVFDWIKNKVQESGVLSKIFSGSFVRLHNCYHDETPPRSCKVTEIWSK